MSPWWSPAVAVLLHALPWQSVPTPDVAERPPAVELADARAGWTRALDAANWDRESPTAIAAADALALRVLPLLARADADVPGPRIEAEILLRDVAPPALGEQLRAAANPDHSLLDAYLRRHDDPALLTALAGPPGAARDVSTLATLTDLAFEAHRAAVAPYLAASASAPTTREAVCRGALGLPEPARASVAAAVLAAEPPAPAEITEPWCVALLGTTRPGRTRLASWLRRLERAPAVAQSSGYFPAVVAALALADGEHRAVTVALAPRLIPAAGSAGVVPIGAFGAALPLRAGAARSLNAWLDANGPVPLASFGLLRVLSGDPDVVLEAAATLASDHGRLEALRAAAGVLGTAPVRSQRELLERAARLAAIAVRLRAAGETGDAEQFSSWAEALSRVQACRGDRTCLVALLESGSDATAARAVVTLGPGRLAALTFDEARPLVRRLVIRADPWTLAATVNTVRGCPRALRGLREVRAVGIREGATDLVQAQLREIERACAAAGSQ